MLKEPEEQENDKKISVNWGSNNEYLDVSELNEKTNNIPEKWLRFS